MKTEQDLLSMKDKLRHIDDRLKNPMASDETIRELLKTKNELLADIQTLEIELDKLEPKQPKSFERLLNEGEEQYGIK
jgi:hypothetical protein